MPAGMQYVFVLVRIFSTNSNIACLFPKALVEGGIPETGQSTLSFHRYLRNHPEIFCTAHLTVSRGVLKSTNLQQVNGDGVILLSHAKLGYTGEMVARLSALGC